MITQSKNEQQLNVRQDAHTRQHGIKTLVAVTAATAMSMMVAVAVADEMPAPRTEGGVTFVTGGIGLDQSQAFAAAAQNYSLELQFLSTGSPRPAYNANVKVSISDSQGHLVLSTVSDGPFMLARLPAGIYQVKATSEDGVTLTRQVSVKSGGHKKASFMWPS